MMDIKRLIFILIVPVVTCGSKHITQSGNYCQFFVEGRSIQAEDEYLDWKSIKINGELPLLTSTHLLYQKIGQPDSIVAADLNEICVSFYDQEFKYGYFKGLDVEIYGDTAVITSVNFTRDNNLKCNSSTITLDHETTLDGLSKVYPNAVSSAGETDVYQLGKVITIKLNSSKDPTDDSWLLFFADGRLIRIDYFMPC